MLVPQNDTTSYVVNSSLNFHASKVTKTLQIHSKK